MGTAESQAKAIADRLLAETEELATFLECISEEQWQTITPEEGWPLTLTVSHAALGFETSWGWIATLLDSGAWPEITLDDIDSANAKNAAKPVERTAAGTLAYLRRTGVEVSAKVAALSDEDLARSAPFLLMGGRTVSVALMAGRIMSGHFAGHVASIRAACELAATDEVRS